MGAAQGALEVLANGAAQASDGVEVVEGQVWNRRVQDLDGVSRSRAAAEPHDARDGGVVEPPRDALVELADRPRGGDDGGEPLVVAMPEELRELLLGPRRGAFVAQVVEHEQGDGAHLLEHLVVSQIAIGGVGRAQVVEQVGGGDEEDGLPGGDAPVGDGGGEVGLAAPRRAEEDEPAVRRGGVGARLVDGRGVDLEGAEGVERHVSECAEVAELGQPVAVLGLEARQGAGAREDLAEVGMPDGNVAAHPADVAAGLALGRGTGRRGLSFA